jgi:hypothetical protein
VRIRVLKNDEGTVIAVESVSAPRQTVGVREEWGTLLAMENQEPYEVEVSPGPSEGLMRLLNRLGFIKE